MKGFLLGLAMIPLMGLSSQAAPLPADCRQVVTVETDNWTTNSGHLAYFQRKANGSWEKVDGWRVRLGRTGLAWGEKPPSDVSGAQTPAKKEGDGKSPAGTFPLLDGFGQASEREFFPNFPFQVMSKEWQGVDDVKSRYYNQLVHVNRIGSPKDWSSSENMCIPEYLLGLRVGYNTEKPIKGRGSCIFVHIFSVPERATAGCTAMEADQLRQLCSWLKKADHPHFVSLPTPAYRQLKNRWFLP